MQDLNNLRPYRVLGIAALLASSLVFAAIAEDVATGDRLVLLDARIAAWLHGHGTASLTWFLLWVSTLHSTPAICSYSLLFGALLAWKRQWRWLGSVALVVAGGMALNVLLKYSYGRARPVFDDPILTLTSYSFPSGHTSGATLFYGVLAAYLLPRLKGRAARIGCGAVAILLVALVALSRMYLGAHYLSDVVAAASVSGAWLALCLTVAGEAARKARFAAPVTGVP